MHRQRQETDRPGTPPRAVAEDIARDSIALIAPRHGDMLASLLAGAGKSSLVVAREQAVVLVESGSCRIVMIDCRGAFEEGLQSIDLLAEPVRRAGGVLLALVGRTDQAALPTLFGLGATHFLAAPFSDIELLETLRFAERMVHRLEGRDLRGDLNGLRSIDPVTGLATEAHLRSHLDKMLAGEGRPQPAAGLLLVSLSRFNRINTRHGREFADRLLRALAQRLLRVASINNQSLAARGRQSLARLGGAEFAILLEPPFELKDAVNLAQQIAEVFERPFVINGTMVHLACRIGISIADDETAGAEQLFRNAAAAAATLVLQEPNSFAVHDSQPGTSPAAPLSLEADLRGAIRDGTLTLAYQPQVDIASNRIIGLEALVRWQHPTLGLLSPDSFVGVAEEAEIMPRLGEYVLREALQEAIDWPLRLAVNVSPAQIRLPGFEAMVGEMLSRSGFSPALLTFEITESALVEDYDTVAAMMRKLQARGIRIAIDDFGTGHASYAQLRQLPFDYLKIDKLFIQAMVQHKRERAMVRSILDMAAEIDMLVIAEGVETTAQLSLLHDHGCAAYQGYLCSPPLPATAVPALLRHWQ